MPTIHSDLVRRIASTLRTDPSLAEQLSKVIEREPAATSSKTVGSFFDSLPDVSGPEFDDAFERGRDRSTPEDVDL